MADWYFERWKPDGEDAYVTELTTDFGHVFAQCIASVRAGEVFRVRPPIGADDQLLLLTRIGKIQKINE